jgi:hypothetical protein
MSASCEIIIYARPCAVCEIDQANSQLSAIIAKKTIILENIFAQRVENPA